MPAPRRVPHRFRLKALYPTDPLVPYPLSPWPTAFLMGFALTLLAVIFVEAKSHIVETALLLLGGAAFFAVYADRSARRNWMTMLRVRQRAIGRLAYGAAWRRLPQASFSGDVLMLLRAHGFVAGLLDPPASADELAPQIRGRTPEGMLMVGFCLPGEDLTASRLLGLLGAAMIRRAQRVIVATTGNVAAEARRVADDFPETFAACEIWDEEVLAQKVLEVSKDAGDGVMPWSGPAPEAS